MVQVGGRVKAITCLRCGEPGKPKTFERGGFEFSYKEELLICVRCFAWLSSKFGTSVIMDYVKRLMSERHKEFDRGLEKYIQSAGTQDAGAAPQS